MSEYPFLRKKIPQKIPITNPTSPRTAFRSPPASLRIILNGQPRNIRQPTIAKNPSTNLVIGALPPLEPNSFLANAATKAPITIPMISGLIYCTGGAL